MQGASNAKSVGSNPTQGTKIRLADRVSVRSPKPRWLGSIPRSRAKLNYYEKIIRRLISY